ncbi:hypothetical protein M569_12339 [Genlisea aurea]|uniref:ABC transporter family G domain-containing protein n=1 Tax=Genlisea aurea TaxID=192259 RepID=S8CDC0_9LAMI|nr:hypothetical protein M569_12339 [Genlisea aurea]
MMVGPTRVFFMDEISNGLDSATTFHIMNAIKHSSHILEETTMISLLQPSSEVYDLFDDIILLAKGTIVYHGLRENVLPFFQHMGFKCPATIQLPDFLQQVLSR